MGILSILHNQVLLIKYLHSSHKFHCTSCIYLLFISIHSRSWCNPVQQTLSTHGNLPLLQEPSDLCPVGITTNIVSRCVDESLPVVCVCLLLVLDEQMVHYWASCLMLPCLHWKLILCVLSKSLSNITLIPVSRDSACNEWWVMSDWKCWMLPSAGLLFLLCVLLYNYNVSIKRLSYFLMYYIKCDYS